MTATKFARWAAVSAALSFSAVAGADGSTVKKDTSAQAAKVKKTQATPKTAKPTDTPTDAKPTDDKGATTLITSKMGKLSDTDLQVLAHVHHGDETEVKSGKMALEKSADRGVKAFAQMLIDDHGSDATNIEQLVKKQDKSLPDLKPMNDADKVDEQLTKETMAKLEGLEGNNFDTEFLRVQVSMHDKTLAKLDKDIAKLSSENPDLASMLRDTRPVIVKHEDMAKKLLGTSTAPQARRAK